jgi:hypothetical protein
VSARTPGLRALVPLLALLLAGNGGAGFRVEGTMKDGFPGSAGVVAVLPVLCPSGVDCAWLDRHVAGEILRRKTPRFLGVGAIREALAKIGAPDPARTELSAENRVALGEALGAQTVLEIRVREIEKGARGDTSDPDVKSDRGDGMAGLVRGRLEIRALAAGSGELLAEGAAFGEAQVVSAKGLLGPMATQLLGRMFPLPRR